MLYGMRFLIRGFEGSITIREFGIFMPNYPVQADRNVTMQLCSYSRRYEYPITDTFILCVFAIKLRSFTVSSIVSSELPWV